MSPMNERGRRDGRSTGLIGSRESAATSPRCDGGGERRCSRCGAELRQKASENGVFVCTSCGGSQLR